MDALVHSNKDNFDDILEDTFVSPCKHNIKHKYPSKPPTIKKRKITNADQPELSEFSSQLLDDMGRFYQSVVGPLGTFPFAYLFDKEDCLAILSHLDNINESKDLRGVIGGECFEGQLKWLVNWIHNFKKNKDSGQQPLADTCGPKRSRINNNDIPHCSDVTQTQVSRRASGQMTKKAQAAEASRLRKITREEETRKKNERDAERQAQVANIMKEVLAQKQVSTS